MKHVFFVFLAALCFAAVSFAAPLHVAATTTIVADVVANIGGDRIILTTLLPIGADPHNFEPTPADAAKLSHAEIIFLNGMHLESALEPLITGAAKHARIVEVSAGIHAAEPEGHDHHDHDHNGLDPHVWTDPHNIRVWISNIVRTLIELDPDGAEIYRLNGERYDDQLLTLDEWIREQIELIPRNHRVLVTDHLIFGYFAERYDFTQIGAIIPGYSTLSEPSARELATLEDAIGTHHVKAIFVGNTVNPTLARRVAEDTGTKLITIYTGALTGPDGGAPTYLDYMRSNVTAIVNGLK